MKSSIAFLNPALSTRNVGDLFIQDSVKRIIRFDAESSVDIDPRKPLGNMEIDRINACDAALIVGTNLWYKTILKEGRWSLSPDILDRIKVPIIPFGVGTTRHKGDDNGFDSLSIDILRRLHDHCEMASVRDQRTQEVMEEIGITNSLLTGCPTLFRSLKPNWSMNKGKDTRDIVVTVRKGQRKNVRFLLRELKESGWNPIVAAQQEKDQYFAKRMPLIQPATPTLYKYDINPYLQLVESHRGSIGWRLHGNMLHLAHGNPAVFFANCSRAKSFCDTFGLPCVVAEDGEPVSAAVIRESIARITDAETFALLPERYRHYRSEMVSFLEKNGLAHNLKDAVDKPHRHSL